MNHTKFPDEIIVHAKATFTNRKTAEKDTVIKLSGTGAYTYNPSEEEKLQMQKDGEAHRLLLQSIPLEQCEVLPDSVQALTYGNTYEYHMGDPLATSYKPITEEFMDAAPFDENGIFRIGSRLPEDGSDGYIAVIKRDSDDTFTGMVDRVRGQLILEYMK